MWAIQVLQRIPRLCTRCVKCGDFGNICILIDPRVLKQYDGIGTNYNQNNKMHEAYHFFLISWHLYEQYF
jgi:hypothetical protein